MEVVVAQLLLTLGLAVPALIMLAFFRRSSSSEQSRGRGAGAPVKTTVLVTDPAIVKLTLIEHADAFSNRPQSSFPRFRGTHSINSVPHGPMWRALRCNLASGTLHPTRLRLVVALQQEAAEGLVADLSEAAAAAAGGAVLVRDRLHASVFALSARFCFGDGVGERCLRALEHEVQQFALTFVPDSKFLAGSGWTTRLRHRRRWLRYSGALTRVYELVHPIIAAARHRKRRTAAAAAAADDDGGGGIRSYLDSLLDLQVPADGDGDDGGEDSGGSKKRRRPLTDQEIVRLVFEFLGADTESIVSCVEWTLAHLVIDPEVQNKLHHEITSSSVRRHDNGGGGTVVVAEEEQLLLRHRLPPYLRAVMLESLRLHPPVPIIPRDVSGKDVVAAAIALAAATTTASPADGMPATVVRTLTHIHKVGRNGKVWTDPDEFRPERFLAGGEAEGVGPVPGPREIRMVPFGAGRRYCPGVEHAMVRIGCILTALVGDFEWALPADDGDGGLDLDEFRGFFLVMKTPLRARITPRTLSVSDAM